MTWILCFANIKNITLSRKQEAHGPHGSPEKQFQSIKTLAQSNDYAITWREKIIISFLRIEWSFVFKNLNPLLSIKDTLRQVWLKLVQWFWRRQFFFIILSIYICYFMIISPWEKEWPFESSSPKNALCQVWLKLAQWFWWRSLDFFKFRQCCLLFHYNLPLREGVALHLNKVESSSSKNALCQVQFGAGIF